MSETDTVEVDRDYLWALETLVVARCINDSIGSDTDPTLPETTEAMDVVHGAGLRRPRDRYPNQDESPYV